MAVVTHRKGGSPTWAHFFPWILVATLSRSLGIPHPLMMGSLPHPAWELEEAVRCQLGALRGEPSLWELKTWAPTPRGPRLCLHEAAPCGCYSYLFSGSLHIYYSTKHTRQLRPLVFINRKPRPGEGEEGCARSLGESGPMEPKYSLAIWRLWTNSLSPPDPSSTLWG